MSRKIKDTNDQTERVQLANAIQAIAKAEVQFSKSVENLKEWSSDKLIELELTIVAKRKELDDIREEFDQKRKSGEIEINTELKAHGRSVAIKYLKEFSEEPINSDEKIRITNEITELKNKLETEISSIRDHHKRKSDARIVAASKQKDLEMEAKMATTTAQNEQLKQQLSNMFKQITKLEEQLESQRTLIKDVAQAGARSITLSSPTGSSR